MMRRNIRRQVRLLFDVLEERCLLTVLPLYYSYDGTQNNRAHPDWGSAGTDLLRLAGTAYADGVSVPRGEGSQAGTLPNAREISNVLATQSGDILDNRQLTAMIYAWGQFIDHDLDLTPAGTTADPIVVPAGDPVFTPGSTIPFDRAVIDSTTGTSTNNPLLQPNTITSFLDGSMIYGSDATRAAALRSFVGGHLKTSAGDLLPYNTADLAVATNLPGEDPTTLFLTGDVRGNENPELMTLETLFVREHNYWADQLAAAHPNSSDEQLYQGARQIVIAEIQAITFNEFLPALLGANALTPYTGYQPSVDPTISAEFSTAAYRLGHTQLGGDIEFLNNDGSDAAASLDFNATADDPSLLSGAGTGVDNIVKYLTADNAQAVDNRVVDAFRNFLFDPTDSAVGGLDLYAIDIQRGRDLGLPDYNTVRAAFGLPRVTSFSQISSDPTVQAGLRQLYGTNADGSDKVDAIDVFVGGLAEDHVAGGSVGPLFTRIIADQFERVRDGDRFWYQRIFSGSDLQRIQQTTLADVIRRNSSVTNLQDNVFFFTTGTISGRVFQENQGTDAHPIGLAGVTVQLRDAAGQPLAQVVTAADGSYQFTGGTPGATYQVAVLSSAGLATPGSQIVQLADTSNAGQFGVDFTLTSSHTQSAPGIYVVGAPAGSLPEVKVYDTQTDLLKFDFFAYSPSVTGGVRVAVGDVNADGIPDIVTGTGAGSLPEIKVFDGQSGALLRDFFVGFAFDPMFTGGVFVAAGDVNGDGTADIVAGADQSGLPEVKVFSGRDGQVLYDFLAYNPLFSGGVRVAAGDVNGDGRADLVVAPGPGGLPEVRVFNGRGGALLQDYLVYDPGFSGGCFVAAGDVNGDGRADVIATPGYGPPVVRVYDGASTARLLDFLAYPPSAPGQPPASVLGVVPPPAPPEGLHVAAADLNGDGKADMLVTPGAGGGAEFRALDALSLAVLDDFFAYDPTIQGGAWIAGG